MISIDPETANFEKVYLSAGIIGTYIGVILDQKNVFGTANLSHFYETDLLTSFKRIVACVLFGFPTLMPLFIPKTYSYWVVIICRTWATPTVGGMYMFGFNKYVNKRLGIANTKRIETHPEEILVYMDGIDRNSTKVKQT